MDRAGPPAGGARIRCSASGPDILCAAVGCENLPWEPRLPPPSFGWRTPGRPSAALAARKRGAATTTWSPPTLPPKLFLAGRTAGRPIPTRRAASNPAAPSDALAPARNCRFRPPSHSSGLPVGSGIPGSRTVGGLSCDPTSRRRQFELPAGHRRSPHSVADSPIRCRLARVSHGRRVQRKTLEYPGARQLRPPLQEQPGAQRLQAVSQLPRPLPQCRGLQLARLHFSALHGPLP